MLIVYRSTDLEAAKATVGRGLQGGNTPPRSARMRGQTHPAFDGTRSLPPTRDEAVTPRSRIALQLHILNLIEGGADRNQSEE